MIPQQELINIDDLIIKNINLSDEDIIKVIGESYYQFYKNEIDMLIYIYHYIYKYNDITVKDYNLITKDINYITK